MPVFPCTGIPCRTESILSEMNSALQSGMEYDMSGANNSNNPSPPRSFPRPIRNWVARHRHPFNFWIHMLGIPIAVAGLILLLVRWDLWYWGVAGLVVGYALQWLGHKVEGNDVGEWAGIKRLLGLPYVGISPRWQELDAANQARQSSQSC
jgi:hypothetical protein